MSEFQNYPGVPADMAEADRLVREAVQKISEHVDSITIFVNKKREDGNDGTWRMAFGAGNWYARYGQIKHWVVAEEGLSTKEHTNNPDES